jgi:hypothetical protein
MASFNERNERRIVGQQNEFESFILEQAEVFFKAPAQLSMHITDID